MGFDRPSFIAFSADVTGFDAFDLVATDLADTYFRTFQTGVSPDVAERLYGEWAWIGETASQADRLLSMKDRVFAAPDLALAARRLVLLWYTGAWYDGDLGAAQVLSPSSYAEGLMWRAVDAHPMAARPGGYGSWASPPGRSA